MGGGNERQEVHDRSRAYWKVIWAAVPVLDGPAPAIVCEGGEQGGRRGEKGRLAQRSRQAGREGGQSDQGAIHG